jgi:hypothetical protein
MVAGFIKIDHEDSDWEIAQAALATAQAMPGGPARVEALKIAGRMRFAATEKQIRDLASPEVATSS